MKTYRITYGTRVMGNFEGNDEIDAWYTYLDCLGSQDVSEDDLNRFNRQRSTFRIELIQDT